MIDSVPEEIRVLHVDDEPDFADMAATFLEREDDRFSVETATSAAAGRDRLASGTEDGECAFDCVVSDYDMPGETGIEFLDAVRTDCPDLPFILFTGKGSEEVASEAISAGVTDYLQKGRGSEQYELLANRIRNAVDATESRRLLGERTRQLETLISNLPGLVYRCRNERGWPMETVEGEAASLTGHTAGTLERNDVSWGEDVIHPDDRERVWEEIQAGLSGSEAFEVTYRIVTADGDERWMWERGQRVSAPGADPAVLEGFVTDVTERKERERRLERTTARLKALFENSPDMINVHDTDGNLIDPNPRLCEQTGYDAAELEAMSVWDLDERLDRADAQALWQGMETGDRYKLDGEYRRRDGSTFPVEVHIQRLDLEGEDRFVVISRDVSERADRQRELRRYERMVATMQEAACIYDEDGRFEVVNDYLASFYNTTTDELEGTQSNLVPRIREQQAGDPYGELLEGDREEIRGEVEGEFPGAGYEVLSYRLTPLVVDGEIEGAVGVAHEVTEQRARQRETERTNELLSTLFETLPVGVLAENESRHVLAANERLFDLFDMPGTPAEVVGADCEQLARAVADQFEDGTGFVEGIDRIVDAGEPVYGEELALRDGRTVGRSHRPIELPDGEGHLWVYRDVTAQKRRERELQRQNERLDEFASVVSHDLRNPLNVASGRLELARSERDSDSLDEVAQAHERMETLVEDLLTLAREGETVDDPEPVELRPVVENCWENVAAPAATLEVDVEADETVPADRTRLKQLVENLYRNAVEHGSTSPGSQTRQDAVEGGQANPDSGGSGEGVTVTVGELDDGVYVADDGPGIPPEERENVFEAGYSTSASGTGFGLRIVAQIAQAHGWTVRVTESESGGARFEISDMAIE
jgi:PAS domain S-box-containing protein